MFLAEGGRWRSQATGSSAEPGLAVSTCRHLGSHCAGFCTVKHRRSSCLEGSGLGPRRGVFGADSLGPARAALPLPPPPPGPEPSDLLR